MSPPRNRPTTPRPHEKAEPGHARHCSLGTRFTRHGHGHQSILSPCSNAWHPSTSSPPQAHHKCSSCQVAFKSACRMSLCKAVSLLEIAGARCRDVCATVYATYVRMDKHSRNRGWHLLECCQIPQNDHQTLIAATPGAPPRPTQTPNGHQSPTK